MNEYEKYLATQLSEALKEIEKSHEKLSNEHMERAKITIEYLEQLSKYKTALEKCNPFIWIENEQIGKCIFCGGYEDYAHEKNCEYKALLNNTKV